MSIYYKHFRSLLIVIIVSLIYVSCGGGSSSPAPQSAATDPPTNTSPTTSPNNPFLLILPGDSTPGNPIITDARTIAVAQVGASATVQVFLDGSLMGTLTAPNQYGAFNEPLYLFQETYPPGTHSVKAIATYSDGTTAQATGHSSPVRCLRWTRREITPSSPAHLGCKEPSRRPALPLSLRLSEFSPV